MAHLQKCRNRRLAVQSALIALGIGMLILGIYTDEVKTVLTKAVYICLECIGIG